MHLAARFIFQFDPPRMVWDTIKVQPPIIGATARKIAMSRFCRALAVLYSAGMTLSEAVSTAADACANLYIGRGIKRVLPAVRAGQGLTESLTRTRAVSPIVLDMLATGEKTGNMDAVLQKVSEYMDEETDATIHKLGVVLFVSVIVVAGIKIGMMVIAFYSGYFQGVMKAGGGG